jgi:hypothetical protein
MNRDCAIHSILGALTADAAALGLHWLYDTDRLASVTLADGFPEFLKPLRENYEGYFGYFAHDGLEAGDSSHYGASVLLMLRSLAAHGRFSIKQYENSFRMDFGPGGGFCGYIDNATRVTLENLNARDKDALSEAEKVAGNLSEEVRTKLIGKVVPYTRQFTGEDLLKPIERAVRITYDDDHLVRVAWEMGRAIDRVSGNFCGADDDQVSATAKHPPLVACYAGDSTLIDHVKSAVSVTNLNHEALSYSVIVARSIEAAISGANPEEIISSGLAVAPDTERQLIVSALEQPKEDPVAVGRLIGQTCYLREAVPLVFYLLRNFHSFSEAIRTNIRIGGDSCGRGIILGAILGSLHGIGNESGIPLDWLLRTSSNGEAAELFQVISKNSSKI